MANLRTYEVMFIVKPDTPTEEVERIVSGLSDTVVSLGGNITKSDIMGRRHLAYPIEKKKEGIYVLFEIDGTGKEIAELERRMRVAEQIMRYISVRVDLDRRASEKVRKKREGKTTRRSFKSQGGKESAQAKPVAVPAE